MHCLVSHRTLSVVTLNTWKAGGDYSRRLKLMAAQLQALAPDIVMLQEALVAPTGAADEGARADTAAYLAAALGLDRVDAPARPQPRRLGESRIDSTLGLSILSRLPLVLSRRVALPTDPRDGERIALMATLEWKRRTLGLVNLHLTYLPDADDLRRRQLQTVIAELPRIEVSSGAGAPVDGWIVAGDFNAEAGSPLLRWLCAASGWRVLDAWDAAGGPCPTLTEPEGSTTLGDRCVDHIFVLQPATRRVRFTFTEAGRVLDQPDPATGILPSDHAGLHAVLMTL